jgi:dihydroneopterin aldolase
LDLQSSTTWQFLNQIIKKIMPEISIEGMKFFAHHGFYPEEHIIGNEFLVDVTLKTPVTNSTIRDNLYDTINYETIYLICEAEMKKSCKLLETVAFQIVGELKHQFSTIEEVKVKVTKLNPPIGAQVQSASVALHENYKKNCGRCGKSMICYEDSTCWCMNTVVFDKTLEQIKSNYLNKCICKECLSFFTGPQNYL